MYAINKQPENIDRIKGEIDKSMLIIDVNTILSLNDISKHKQL